MTTRVLITALSVDYKTLDEYFVRTYESLVNHELSNKVDFHSVVFTQGFVYDKVVKGIDFIYDDTMYGKGYSISEIRDYFTERLIEEYNFDYFYFCDDDFKFNTESLRSIYNDMTYMDINPEVGLTSMHYKKNGPGEVPDYYYDFLPSRVAMCSGMMVRKSAFNGWGGSLGIRYFEECSMAAYVYANGYRVVHSLSNTIHRTKPTGLGISQERQYGKNNIPKNGRRVMCEEGLFIPSIGKDENGNKFHRYDVPLKNSEKLEKLHESARLGLTSTI